MLKYYLPQCDGRRPVCYNCQRSRGHICRGFIENSRHTAVGEDTSEPIAKTRRTGNRRDSSQEIWDQVLGQSAVTGPTQAGTVSRQRQLSLGDDSRQAPSISPRLARAPVGQTSPDDQSNDDLLDYYKHIVTGVMMPTIDPSSNPWLQIYFPLALGEPSTPSQLALRHALMSVAAYQRAYHEGKSKQQDIQKGLHHEQEASRILEQAVDSGTPSNPSLRDKCTSLAAALGLISIDIFGPRATDCSIRLNLARRIIDMYGDETCRSYPLFSMLYQIFRCYEMVASTTKLATETMPDTSGSQTLASDEDNAQSVDGEIVSRIDTDTGFEQILEDARYFILNSSFGVSWRTMSLLHQTTSLGALCTEPNSGSSSIIKQIRDLHRRLYSIEDDPSEFLAPVSPGRSFACLNTGSLPSDRFNAPDRIVLPKVISDELIENHQWAFHYAVIIYFHRVVPDAYLSDLDDGTADSPQRGIPTEVSIHGTSNRQDYQILVGKIWDRLENIDCLTPWDTQRHRGNVLWPAFIAAVESIQVELRHRALIWFSKAARRGIGNIPRAKEVVMEVWRRVDRLMYSDGEPVGLGPVDWRAVMRDTGHSILLT